MSTFRTISFLLSLVLQDIWFAGAFAAFTVDLLVYPLDTLKTRIQSPDYTKLYKESNGKANRALFRGLYQGIGSVILITIPSSGAFFTTYEALKFTINEACPPNSTLYLPQPAINAISSTGAELVSCAILTPAEVLKQNAQVIVQDGKGSRSTTLQVLKKFKNNPNQLFRGYTALAARNLPFTGLQFPLFEHLKGYFLARRNAKKGSDAPMTIPERAGITAMSASIAGSGAAWITTPIDVVKTRMMLAASKSSEKPEQKDMSKLLSHGLGRSTGKSPFAIAGDVFKKEGVKGLFRGALLRAVWTSIGSGLYLGCYEGGRFYLEENRKNNDGDHVMQKDYKDVKVGIGKSRSQETVKKSAWQDD